MSIKKKIFLFLFFFVIILFFIWYLFGGTRVIALKIQRQNAVKGITVTGNVESSEDVKITANVTSKIEKIFKRTGDKVKKSDILAFLEREEITGQVASAEASIYAFQEQEQRTIVQYKDAVFNEKRYSGLFKEGAVSERDLEERKLRRQELEESIDELKQKIKVSRGELKSAKSRLDDYIIKAPFSGIITDKYVSTGDIVSPQQPLFRLIYPEGIYLEADVEEDELEAVNLGQKTLIIFDAYPEQIFEGKIYLISKEINPVTGTFEARITRPDMSGYSIYVGMTFDATIIIEEYKDIIVIPTNYIKRENSEVYVFILKNGFTYKKYIKTEYFNNNSIRVIKGLKQGDIVLKKEDTGFLKDGEKIKIIEHLKQ